MAKNNKLYKRLYPGFKKKAVTFSFDDGTFQDMEMVNMLNHLNMKATFNLNSKLMYENSAFTMDNWIKNYRINKKQVTTIYKGHEIASHTSTHTDFKNLSDELLISEIDDDIKNLKKIAKEEIIGFAYPYGIYNDTIISHLKKNGIIYARSTESTFNFDLPDNWYTYGGTCTISDYKFKTLINKWLKLNPKDLKIFYIWGHAYELDMFHEHEKVFELFTKIANKDDVWYATNKEIVSYLLAFEKLIYDRKTKCLINNSNTNLYIQINDQNYLIKKGSKIKI